MNRQCQLSNVTKDYLIEFHCILDEMIQGMTSATLTDSISHNYTNPSGYYYFSEKRRCRDATASKMYGMLKFI